MYKTNFNQSNIIKGDNVILPMEGKLFRVKNLETENFEEFTTPIKDLVDMTPFSLWFSQDYYFIGNKKYYEVKLMSLSARLSQLCALCFQITASRASL